MIRQLASTIFIIAVIHKIVNLGIVHKFSQKNSADHTINAKQKSVPAKAETLPFSL